MSYNLIVTNTAALQARQAYNYLVERTLTQSERFLTELAEIYDKLIEHPQYYSFITAEDELRDVKLPSFPYVVVFEIFGDDVTIIEVRSTHQNPRY